MNPSSIRASSTPSRYSAWVGATSEIVEDGLDLRQLPAFLRVLLTTDGTVTNSLEAFFWEPVAVETLSQEKHVLPKDEPAIARKAKDAVILRSVQLRGVDSARVYARARSLICVDILPPDFRGELEAQHIGIGELLRESGLETYREILRIGFAKPRNEIWRSYRIVMNHQPFIKIDEHFPLELFQTG